MEASPKIVHVFVAYSQKDIQWKNKLLAHLDPMARRAWIDLWHDTEIEAGAEWEKSIHQNLDQAEIVLLLLSPNSLQSDYFYEVEMQKALTRHETGQSIVIPILLEHCLWDLTPIAKLEVLPSKAKPVSEWENPHQAMNQIASEIRKRVEQLRGVHEEVVETEMEDISLAEQVEEAIIEEQQEEIEQEEAVTIPDFSDIETAPKTQAPPSNSRKYGLIAAAALIVLLLLLWGGNRLIPLLFFSEDDGVSVAVSEGHSHHVADEGQSETATDSLVAEIPADVLANDLVWVDAGRFRRGCSDENVGQCFDDEKEHEVSVSAFYIGKHEVTNAEYCGFLNAQGEHQDWIDFGHAECLIKKESGKYVPKSGKDDYPVSRVNWFGAMAYCAWLGQEYEATYRLPTEAEWEFAARGGKESKGYAYAGSDDADSVAWYAGNASEAYTHQVGQKKPNELGLFDMTGNVLEWCRDWYGEYPSTPQTNPEGVENASEKVVRGGSSLYQTRHLRVSDRMKERPEKYRRDLGFRVVREK